MGPGVDEDEGAGLPVARVGVYEQGGGAADAHPGDVVRPHRPVVLHPVQGVDVDAVQHLGDARLHLAGGVPDDVALGRAQRRLAQPADARIEFRHRLRAVLGAHQHVPPGDVDVLAQGHGHAHGRERPFHRLVAHEDGLHGRTGARRQREHLVPGLEYPGRHPARVAAEVPGFVALGADDHLDREPAILQVAVARDMHVFEVLEQGGPAVPGHGLRAVHHVVPPQRGDGDELDVRDVQPRGEIFVRRADVGEHLLAEVHQVHLVHADHDVLDSQQRGDETVAVGLFYETMPGIDQDDGQVRRGRPGHHVAGVLDVARGVGDDELALGRGEVAVGHVDGDALLALGPQPVSQQAQVRLLHAPLAARRFHRGQLVLKDAFRVEQQAADQGAFPVIDASGGGKSEHGGKDRRRENGEGRMEKRAARAENRGGC